MQDRELLELAAKAAGQFVDRITSEGVWIYPDGADSHGFGIGLPCLWNPLASDGDALRLAVRLKIGIELRDSVVAAAPHGEPLLVTGEMYCDNGGNEHSATRRAIVRAAAEIGKNS